VAGIKVHPIIAVGLFWFVKFLLFFTNICYCSLVNGIFCIGIYSPEQKVTHATHCSQHTPRLNKPLLQLSCSTLYLKDLCVDFEEPPLRCKATYRPPHLRDRRFPAPTLALYRRKKSETRFLSTPVVRNRVITICTTVRNHCY
jgi:hypothetical protein